jgi:hypothetical protein
MNKNAFYKKQFIGLVIVALALQGVLSLLGYWGLYSIQNIFLWLIRLFLLGELVFGLYHYFKEQNTFLPWIGKYFDKAF